VDTKCHNPFHKYDITDYVKFGKAKQHSHKDIQWYRKMLVFRTRDSHFCNRSDTRYIGLGLVGKIQLYVHKKVFFTVKTFQNPKHWKCKNISKLQRINLKIDNPQPLE